jgi:hypothetical protein
MITLLRLCATALIFIAVSSARSQTEPIPDADAQSIRAVIEAQLAAFASGDAEKAFSFASESIRKTFGSAENFVAMVRTSYAVVTHPASVLFLERERIDGAVVQAVQMTDDEGQLWLALYRMQQQTDDSWRIAGCVLRAMQGSRT